MDKSKYFFAAFLTVLVYFSILFFFIYSTLNGWGRNSAYDTFNEYMIAFLVCLFAIPIGQIILARQLKSEETLSYAKGIKLGVKIETVILALLILILLFIISKI